jgi:hypothetical protein
MNSRCILSPEAGLDLLQIWRYIGNEASYQMATALSRSFWRRSFTWRETPEAATHGRI